MTNICDFRNYTRILVQLTCVRIAFKILLPQDSSSEKLFLFDITFYTHIHTDNNIFVDADH